MLLHVLVLLVSQNLGRGLGIIEEFTDLFHVLLLNAVLPVDLCQQVGWGQQLHRIPTAQHSGQDGATEGSPKSAGSMGTAAWLQQSSCSEPRVRTAKGNFHCPSQLRQGHQEAGDRHSALLETAKEVTPFLLTD